MNILKNKYSLKDVLVFDWDGTLFDSMPIKRENFCLSLERVFKEKTIDFDIVMNLYMKYSGMPRFDIFNFILNDLSISFSRENYKDFDLFFTELNYERLRDAKLFEDAIEFLFKLKSMNVNLNISSSVPEKELRILTELKLKELGCNVFNLIIGTSKLYSKGSGHFNYISKSTKKSFEHFIFFGDDFHDYEAAKESDIDFIMIDREERFIDHTFCSVSSFNTI